MTRRVLLIGTGLIGGSIALAIKKEANDVIVGYDINKEQLYKARELQVIDEAASSLQEEAEKASLIILASPVEQTLKLMRKLASFHLREDVVISDVGSTKGEIMALANELWQEKVTFIGGHPMAGSHKAGVESAKAHLFENAFYVLTPHSFTSFEKVEELKRWLKGTNAHFLVLDTEEHDYMTGVISHFPHVVASALVKVTKKHAEDHPLISLLAAGGFRDITRIASSSPNMWTDIVKQNRHNILHLLEEWIVEMRQFQHVLLNKDDKALSRFFADAKDYRDALPVRSKGAIPAYYDLYVDIVDATGEIARITTLLAEHGISITNLHIIESREGLLGVLQLSFQSDEDRLQAQALLKHHAYKTYDAA